MEMPTACTEKAEVLSPGANQAARSSAKPLGTGEVPGELDFHASGFVAGVNGCWTPANLTQFRRFLYLRRVSTTEEELLSALERARQQYVQGETRLYLCGADPCCQARGFETSEAALAAASRVAASPISTTGCLGQCKYAPVLSFRIRGENQMFAQVANGRDWEAVLAFVRSAVEADSLLVGSGKVQALFHDPVHHEMKPNAHLKPLQFLIGHFRGEGRCAPNGYAFQKEVVGTSEAGGRFIALRMAASYPLADGRKDTHRALVIVGPKPGSGGIVGRAYTDGGSVCEYEVETDGQVLSFADAFPDHAHDWKSSRKLLKPSSAGFEEQLEVDDGGGAFTYYAISMQRVGE